MVICLCICFAVILIDDSGAAIISPFAVVAKVLMLLDAPIDLKDIGAVELNNLPPEPDLIPAGLMVLVDILMLFPDCLKF